RRRTAVPIRFRTNAEKPLAERRLDRRLPAILPGVIFPVLLVLGRGGVGRAGAEKDGARERNCDPPEFHRLLLHRRPPANRRARATVPLKNGKFQASSSRRGASTAGQTHHRSYTAESLRPAVSASPSVSNRPKQVAHEPDMSASRQPGDPRSATSTSAIAGAQATAARVRSLP